MDGRDIWVPTTSFLFGASHAVSYVYICLKTFDLDLTFDLCEYGGVFGHVKYLSYLHMLNPCSFKDSLRQDQPPYRTPS
jgi:hypothetical protein